jgi:type VI secretion system (T6SS) effector Tae4 (amidase)
MSLPAVASRVDTSRDEAIERDLDAEADRPARGQSQSMADIRLAYGERARQKETLGQGEEAFQTLWSAHPHNYQAEDAPDRSTDDDEVRDEHGLPDYMDNTCAIRLSVMLNGSGHRITPAKAKAAGLSRAPSYSRKTRQYYIIAAREMWQYLERHFRQEDVSFPPDGRFADEEAFLDAYETTIKPVVAARKGIVAFDKIFGYGGTGHVDLFDGEKLSDAPGFYPCQKLRLWFIVVP